MTFDKNLCRTHQNKKSVRAFLVAAARADKGSPRRRRFLRQATVAATKWEARLANRRTKAQIATDRAALLAFIEADTKGCDTAWTPSRYLPAHKPADLTALVKAGKLQKDIYTIYEMVENRDNLFGGQNACQRKIARYRLTN